MPGEQPVESSHLERDPKTVEHVDTLALSTRKIARPNKNLEQNGDSTRSHLL
jgi:hypothetical protein